LTTLFVFAVLVASAFLLLAQERQQLAGSVDRSLQQRADTIEELFRVDQLAQSVTTDDDDRAIQVVDRDGVVVASSTNISGLGSVASLDPSADETIRTVDDFPLDDEDVRLLSRWFETADGRFVVHVAESTDDLDDVGDSLMSTLRLGIVALTALVATLTWWLVGRTLRPVDAMRAEVDAIDDSSQHHQLADSGRDDEMGRLARTLNEMLDRLHRSGEQQRQFVDDAAHELRTPLTRIRATVEVDLAQPDSADPARTNAEVRAEAIGLQRLINDLLLLARADSGRSPQHHRLLDLDDVVMAEVHDQRRAQTLVTIDAAGVSGHQVRGDESQLRRAVQNLLSNATRHAESLVEVSLVGDAEQSVFTVDDDGPGIPPNKRGVVFDRFTRLDEARSANSGGAGLGLAITRDIVERHGGAIGCQDSPLGGARFVVTLPAPNEAYDAAPVGV
jgi:signal transduction histidine kinase